MGSVSSITRYRYRCRFDTTKKTQITPEMIQYRIADANSHDGNEKTGTGI